MAETVLYFTLTLDEVYQPSRLSITSIGYLLFHCSNIQSIFLYLSKYINLFFQWPLVPVAINNSCIKFTLSDEIVVPRIEG